MAWKAALKEADESCNGAIARCERQMGLARKCRLAGEILTLIGSSTLVVKYQEIQGPPVLVVGLMALIGSLACLLAEYAIRPHSASGRTVLEVHRDLVSIMTKAQELSRTFAGYGDSVLVADTGTVTQLGKESEKVIADAYKLFGELAIAGKRPQPSVSHQRG